VVSAPETDLPRYRFSLRIPHLGDDRISIPVYRLLLISMFTEPTFGATCMKTSASSAAKVRPKTRSKINDQSAREIRDHFRCFLVQQKGSHRMNTTQRSSGPNIPSRVAILALPAFALMLTFVGSTPAFADEGNAGISDPNGYGCGSPSSIASSGVASQACSYNSGAVSGTLAAVANLGNGSLGASSSFFASELGVNPIPLSASSELIYNFMVSGVSTGTADFTLEAQGQNTCINEQCLAAALLTSSNLQNVAIGNGTSFFNVSEQIANGQLTFGFSLSTQVECATIVANSCGASSDFIDTVNITGAQVFDANGNLVSNAVLTSDSGYNPNAGTSVSAPEPSALSLLCVGVLGLVGLAAKKAHI
jgi:hypothetical protein